MNILYAIEPDLCITNPGILINFPLDIVLPQYILTQINHLSNSDFGNVTVSANKILTSLQPTENTDLLIFNTNNKGTIYFIDETIYHLQINREYENIDPAIPINRYLLSLLYLSNILESQIIFLAASSEIIRKCRIFNFETVNLADFQPDGKSWLTPEILVNITTNNPDLITATDMLNPSEIEEPVQIEWQDIRISQGINNIKWIEIK
jgi:hypothetical protein